MSDNLRQYRAIRDALTQGYPGEPTGRLARHLATLAAFISGIVASKSTQLPKVASHVPDGTKPESRVKRLARWVDNDTITEDVYFFPYAQVLLAQLALQTLVRVRRANAPCGLQRARPASGVAGAPRQEGAFPRSPPSHLDRAGP